MAPANDRIVGHRFLGMRPKYPQFDLEANLFHGKRMCSLRIYMSKYRWHDLGLSCPRPALYANSCVHHLNRGIWIERIHTKKQTMALVNHINASARVRTFFCIISHGRTA